MAALAPSPSAHILKVVTGAASLHSTAGQASESQRASVKADGWKVARTTAGSGSAANGSLWKVVRRRATPIGAAAAAFHTSDGGVNRNDAASTGPLFKPDPKISLEEAVRLQMDALACSDKPRPDHGLEVVYGFAITDGTESGGSLSKYFGFPSDLYHFGHFALKFKKRYPELINHAGYEILKTETEDQDNRASVAVRAKTKSFDNTSWVFSMSRVSRGVQDPCWLTSSLQRYTG